VADRSVAVVDIGSNSGRVVVIRIGNSGELEILANGRAPLRLGRDLTSGDVISSDTIERTAATVRDFRAIGESAGAETLIPVATSAVRESANADEFVSRVEAESGVRVRVIDGDDEARYTFLGAVRGLPVQHGVVADLGGGSLELTRFRERRAVRAWTLPLGSLRLSDRFLHGDPAETKEVSALARFARMTLKEAGVHALGPDERLIGTGGTIRNLAKIDMASRRYPIPRLHGYVLAQGVVQETGDRLASQKVSRRRSVRGLSRERADSIVGGALAVRSLMEHLKAPELTVSGRGLREGVALDSARLPDASIEEVRQASVRALAHRFSSWDPGRAARRAVIAERLLTSVDPGSGTNVRERLIQAATLLDVGRSVDYYRRFDHTADIIIEADLDCFSHRKLALLSAVVRQAGAQGMSITTYRPLLGPDDGVAVARSATLLYLADTVEQHLPPRDAGDVTCRLEGKRAVLEAPVYDPWRQEALSQRFRATFAKKLEFAPAP
jgi:exopolyphosphatase/guanosine-5'-triphosphate,3'-diphosphate pyrophosphatase